MIKDKIIIKPIINRSSFTTRKIRAVAGVNSEHIRHAIQNRAIHNGIGDRGFTNQSWDWQGYTQYRTPSIFTSW